MSREKQIEEIGMSGYSKFAWKLWSELKLPMTQCLVIEKIVQEQGYRKQREGEFVMDDLGNVCTVCGRTYDPQFDIKPRIIKEFKFCPNCGAKMKGGE